MKKGILLLFVVLMGFTSCGKKFGHRYLDGMWQMQRIEYKVVISILHWTLISVFRWISST